MVLLFTAGSRKREQQLRGKLVIVSKAGRPERS